MRIAFLGDASLTHVIRWVQFFKDEGHDVLLITFEEPLEAPFKIERLKGLIPTKLGGYISRLATTKELIKKFDPDVVNSIYAAGYGPLGALSTDKPLVVTCLGSDILVDYPSSLIHRLQVPFALKKARLITVDADLLTERIEQMGISRKKIIKTFFGIDDRLFHPLDDKEWPDRDPSPTIISTRKLFSIYDLDMLIDAVPLILSSKPNAKVVICGDGPERGRLENRAAAIGIEESIIFKGALTPEEIAGELQKADIYVSTSRSDSTSVSLLEAMACGIPPVVTDIEANREWIENGKNGILVPAGNAKELAMAIINLVNKKDLLDSMRRLNLSLVERKGLWQENMKLVEERIVSLAGQS
ncbi:MAG: hypothetical protein B6D63_00940 [Candidatus Latescibacteria bacterium 4484_7]|nr:MAG: hypothetical protein B6D63_00940 [Candidatus Latescibacteria bacterium 4484_7]